MLRMMPQAQDVGEQWEEAFTFERESCGVGVVKALNCGSYTDPALTRDNANIDQTPFLVIVNEECSTIGSVNRDYLGRARRKLDAVKSYYVAAEVWDAAVIGANYSLNESTSDTITDEPTEVVRAVAWVEQAIGVAGKGQEGLIHAPANIAAFLYRNNLVIADGQTLRSPMGHRWVWDAGYSGSGPGGIGGGSGGYSTWIYGTSWMEWFAGPVVTIPDAMDDQGWRETLTRTMNLEEVWAIQPFGIRWDQCVHIAAELNVPWSTIIGSGS